MSREPTAAARTRTAEQVLTATAVWPFPASDRAPAALRAQLREAALDEHLTGRTTPTSEVPLLDWTTLTVSRPAPDIDDRGRTWFRYTATVNAVPLPRADHRTR